MRFCLTDQPILRVLSQELDKIGKNVVLLSHVRLIYASPKTIIFPGMIVLLLKFSRPPRDGSRLLSLLLV